MQVSELVMLTRSDEDELKVKALEYAAPVGQHVWAKVKGAGGVVVVVGCGLLYGLLWQMCQGALQLQMFGQHACLQRPAVAVL